LPVCGVLRSPIKKPKFKVFDNEEIYLPTPDMVKTFSALELTKFLSEGFQLVTKTEWGYCLNRPKSVT
jgi:hypothetical protein